MDDFAEPADFVRLQKRRRAAAKMELDDLALRVQLGRHFCDFTAQRLDISHAPVVIQRNDGGAAAKPAECFAERDVKINREVAGRAVVLLDLCGKLFPRDGVGEFRGRRIAGVTRSGHVVFLHQIQIDVQHTHLKFFTVSTRAAMFSSLASGGTPWPRLKMWPRAPRMSVRIRPVSTATISGLVMSKDGSRLPCTPTCSGSWARTSASRTVQSIPSTFAPVSTSVCQWPWTSLEKTMTGTVLFSAETICLIHRA